MLLDATEQIDGVTQPIGGATGVLGRLPVNSAAHGLFSLAQAVQGLLRVRTCLRVAVAAAARQCARPSAAGWTLSAALATGGLFTAGPATRGLAIARLTAAGLTPIAALPAGARQLFQLSLQLFHLPPQHLLLPALLGAALRVAAVSGGELALPARQLVEFFQRLIDCSRLLAGRCRSLGALVGILLHVQLEVEQARQVATGGIDRTRAAAAAPKSNLDLPERSFRAQQVLQSLLLIEHRRVPLLLIQLLRRGSHGGGRRLHILLETTELLVGELQVAHLEATRQGQGLGTQRILHVGEEFGLLGGRARGAVLLARLLPGGGDDLLLALGDLCLVVGNTPATSRAAHLLGLRELALERVDLDEADVSM